LFEFVFDKKYFSAYQYVPLLMLSTIIATISIFFGGIQIGLKNPKANGISTVVGAAVNVLIHLCLVKAIGLYAAVVSTLISQIVVCCLRKIMLKKYINIKIKFKNYKYLILLCYFIICSLCMTKLNIYIKIFNILFSTLILLICCREYLFKIFRKVGVKI
jgi:O-antigen/teichoic acid export membrane protein